MEIRKKITFSQEAKNNHKSMTGFQSKRNSRRKMMSLQDFPLEILVKILSKLPLREAVRLRTECRALRTAAGLLTWWSLMGLSKEVRRILHDPQTKSTRACFLLHTDLAFLRALLWRYHTHINIWSSLSDLLAPIIEELRGEIQLLNKGRHKRDKHPKLSHFFNVFTDQIERVFLNSSIWAPFEVRLIDLLFACQRGNIQLEISRGRSCCTRVKMFYEIKDSDTFLDVPTIKLNLTRVKNEQKIMKYMREFLRKTNRSISRFDYVTSSSENPQPPVRHVYDFSSTSGTVEIYERTSNMNFGKYLLYCYLEANLSKPPECFRDLCNTQHIGDNVNGGLGEILCVTCMQNPMEKVFILRLIKNTSMSNRRKEMIILYDCYKENFRSYSENNRNPSI